MPDLALSPHPVNESRNREVWKAVFRIHHQSSSINEAKLVLYTVQPLTVQYSDSLLNSVASAVCVATVQYIGKYNDDVELYTPLDWHHINNSYQSLCRTCRLVLHAFKIPSIVLYLT